MVNIDNNKYVLIRNIKNELNDLIQKYSNILIEYPYTNAFKEKVYDDFYNWVEYWELEGFKFKLIFDEQEIIFKPLRKIDEYVIHGIINL